MYLIMETAPLHLIHLSGYIFYEPRRWMDEQFNLTNYKCEYSFHHSSHSCLNPPQTRPNQRLFVSVGRIKKTLISNYLVLMVPLPDWNGYAQLLSPYLTSLTTSHFCDPWQDTNFVTSKNNQIWCKFQHWNHCFLAKTLKAAVAGLTYWCIDRKIK